jgi:glycosyltransferase involved in cell wall biosynthesis
MTRSKIKEVTVFCGGDSQKKSTWSGLPYQFTETLLSKNIRVNRVDISESLNAKWWFDRTIRRVARRIHPETSYEYFRSAPHFWRTRQKIQRALRDYPNSDANFFLTFSHSSAGLTQKPTIMLCDWTYHYNITHFLGRAPDIFERSAIKREDREIKRSDIVVSTFPDVTDYMKKRYASTNVSFLGKGFFFMKTPEELKIMPQKRISKEILFIGNSRYYDGAKSLITAYKKIKSIMPGLQLNIIGMQESQFIDLPDGVRCYGYLDKDDPKDEKLYYDLLERAKVFVNTTPKLGSAGAMLEAMLFFTPVVTTPQNYMGILFGNNIEFGHYCRDYSVETLCSKIKAIFETDKYDTLCINANASVKNCSLSICVDSLLNTILDSYAPKNPK